MKKLFTIALAMLLLISGELTNVIAKQQNNSNICDSKTLDLSEERDTITLSDDVIGLLPLVAKNFILKNSDSLVASIVTVHIFSNEGINNQKVVASKNYNLRNKEEIDLLKKDISCLENKDFHTVLNNSFSPLKRDDHSYIITGLNVIKIPSQAGNYELEFQGYWDWKTTMLVSPYDRIGLAWNCDAHKISSTAFGNRYYDGKAVSLTKIGNSTFENEHFGVLWKHNSGYQSYGNVITRIGNVRSGIDVTCWLDYIAPGGPTTDDGWFVDLTKFIYNHFNLPLNYYRFQTKIVLYI